MSIKSILDRAGLPYCRPELVENAMNKLQTEKLKKQEIYLKDIQSAIDCFKDGSESLETTKEDIEIALKNIQEIEEEYMINY